MSHHGRVTLLGGTDKERLVRLHKTSYYGYKVSILSIRNHLNGLPSAGGISRILPSTLQPGMAQVEAQVISKYSLSSLRT